MAKQRIDEFLRREGLDRCVERTQCIVRRHTQFPNLVLLKYDQINSPMADPITQQCRGVILDEDDDWKVVSWPYNKFFNHGEGHAVDVDWQTARVYEKLDGSLCVLYYYRGEWHVSTSGSPDASGNVTHNKNKTFKQLFWQTWQEMGYKLPKSKDMCYMFELMGPENRVVVPHKRNRLVLHGARYVIPKMSYSEVPPEFPAGENSWEVVKTYPLHDLEGVLSMAQSLNGIENEGFVVCDRWFNRQKIKVKSYVSLHHLKSSLSERRLMEIVQANEVQEFLFYFPEYSDEYWRLHDKFRLLCEKADAKWEEVRNIKDRKEFALAVKHLPYCGGLFSSYSGYTKNPSTWLRNRDARQVLKLIGEAE